MPRLAAFFRGLNLGGRRVKMADLRAHLEDLGLEEVATLLASGNAVFDGGTGDGVGAGLGSLETPDDRFLVLGREVLWFRRGGLSDASIGTRDLERVVGPENTTRKIDTIHRVVSRFGD